MDTIDKINYYLSKSGKSGAEMSRALGLSNSAYSQWNTKKTKPRRSKLFAVAEYLGVSYFDLLPDEDGDEEESPKTKKSPAPSAGTEDIMKIYSMLTPERQKQLRSALADLLKEQLQD